MRFRHFDAFAPICPRCRQSDGAIHALRLATIAERTADGIRNGMLHCPDAACSQEYPIIDGIPIIVPEVARFMRDRAAELVTRFDLDPVAESVLGDAIGPDSWFDVLRQTLSTYAWDSWADHDPAEQPAEAPNIPGAARRCLARLLGPEPPTGAARAVDVGCAAGGTTAALAAALPDALVLGIDLHFGLLRIAAGALAGNVAYPRRRVGVVYDRRCFAVAPAGIERVDYWACDGSALPFVDGTADLVAALNLLDGVPEPTRLLRELGRLTSPNGRLLLATPYDWTSRVTPIEAWVGGHSQRGPDAGAAEPLLRRLATPGAHPASLPDFVIEADVPSWPWRTRLHDRAAVEYRTHLLALRRHA